MKKPDVRFCTKEEVEKFKTHPYNREPDPKHIREIKKAMLKDIENFQAIQVKKVDNSQNYIVVERKYQV